MSHKPVANRRDLAGDLMGLLADCGDLPFDWDMASGRVSGPGHVAAALDLPGADDGDVDDGDVDDGDVDDGDVDDGDVGGGSSFAAADFLARIHPEDVPVRRAALATAARTGQPADFRIRWRYADGRVRLLRERTRAITDAGGRTSRLVGIWEWLDEEPESDRLDPLTGCYSRQHLRHLLDIAASAPDGGGRRAGFMLMAINNLSDIGVVYGDAAADRIVVAVAGVLRQILRKEDRFGQDGYGRFGLILRHCSQGSLHPVAERILGAVHDLQVRLGSRTIAVTASAGATCFVAGAARTTDIVGQAENALAAARRLGGDSFADFADLSAPAMVTNIDFAIADAVRGALRNGRVMLACQPVVHAGSGKVAFYEGLARIRAANGDLMPAAKFIPVVEQMGLVRRIDRRVLELGLATLENHPALNLSINLSGTTTSDPAWMSLLQERLAGRPQLAERLILEITETVALDDIDETSRFVRGLAGLGCRVALDDFGAGFSSFRHLRRLRVSIIKIDGSFTRGMAENPDNRIFVRALAGLARETGLISVAECVETADEADDLRQQGVHLLQGYCFGRPEVHLPAARPSARRA